MPLGVLGTLMGGCHPVDNNCLNLVLSFLMLPWTELLAVQYWLSPIGMVSLSQNSVSTLSVIMAAVNYNLGIASCLLGATRALEKAKAQWTSSL